MKSLSCGLRTSLNKDRITTAPKIARKTSKLQALLDVTMAISASGGRSVSVMAIVTA